MDVIMPPVGETVDEGTVIKWFKVVGDHVSEGDILCEVETDKTTMEIPASNSGKIIEIKVQAGEKVPVGTVLAVVK